MTIARSVPPRCAAGDATVAVQTAPSTVAIAAGLLPVGTDSTTRGATGSTRTTAPAPPVATHTAPPPAATPVGSPPTRVSPDTELVAGSIRETVPSWRLATHTAPSPTASAAGPFPTGITCDDGARAGVDARDRPGLLARHPQRARPGGQRGRIGTDGD